ncbi:MAG: hypothetical protein KUG79_18210 [Pseudomonadales bacterium]|nr:hypothetical protein [Pseudomonadales bacterium]
MFNIDEFISDCKTAIEQAEPKAAIKKLVQDAINDPVGLKEAITALGKPASLKDAVLYRSDTLTILPATTVPGMLTPAHDHQMWAVIGVYEGIEPNDFFLDGEQGLEKKSSRTIEQGDVAILEGKTIHAISNPLDVKCYALHVYGGDIVTRPGRSMWNPDTLAREPYDIVQLGNYIKEMRQASSAAKAAQ